MVNLIFGFIDNIGATTTRKNPLIVCLSVCLCACPILNGVELRLRNEEFLSDNHDNDDNCNNDKDNHDKNSLDKDNQKKFSQNQGNQIKDNHDKENHDKNNLCGIFEEDHHWLN